MYITFKCPPLPHLIVGGIAFYREGDRHPSHSYSKCFDLIYIISGKLHLEVNENKITLCAGQFFILPPDTVHKGYKVCEEETHFYWVHFYTLGEFFCAFKQLNSNKKKIKYNQQLKKETFYFSVPQYGTINQLFRTEILNCLQNIMQVCIDKKQSMTSIAMPAISQLKSQQLFLQILTLIYDSQQYPVKKDIAEEIFTYFSVYYQKPFQLKILAKRYSFHPTSIIRCIKQKYGMTPLKLLYTIRIRQAELLLSTTDDSITKISLNVGIIDTAYFSKQFKKLTGVTPSAYRLQYKTNIS